VAKWSPISATAELLFLLRPVLLLTARNIYRDSEQLRGGGENVAGHDLGL